MIYVKTSWYFPWESTGLLAVTESCLCMHLHVHVWWTPLCGPLINRTPVISPGKKPNLRSNGYLLSGRSTAHSSEHLHTLLYGTVDVLPEVHVRKIRRENKIYRNSYMYVHVHCIYMHMFMHCIPYGMKYWRELYLVDSLFFDFFSRLADYHLADQSWSSTSHVNIHTLLV